MNTTNNYQILTFNDKDYAVVPRDEYTALRDTVNEDEATARRWFESISWKDGVAVCHRCGGTNTYKMVNGKPLY